MLVLMRRVICLVATQSTVRHTHLLVADVINVIVIKTRLPQPVSLPISGTAPCGVDAALNSFAVDGHCSLLRSHATGKCMPKVQVGIALLGNCNV
jgi:hypothetical protein